MNIHTCVKNKMRKNLTVLVEGPAAALADSAAASAGAAARQGAPCSLTQRDEPLRLGEPEGALALDQSPV